MDTVYSQLGYLMNVGFTQRAKIYDDTADNLFAISVEIEASDQFHVKNTAQFNVYVAVKFDDFIIVGE